MHSLRNPKWLFLTNTFPIALLLLLCSGEFAVVHTLLPASSVDLWQGYGLALLAMGVIAACYAGTQLVQERPLGGWFSVAVLVGYSVWLCLVTAESGKLLPPGAVPRWMLPTEPLLMAWTFLMPTLAYAMLVLVARLTPDDQPHHAAPNILLAVVTPFGWWLVFAVLSWIEDHTRGASTAPYASSRWDVIGGFLLVVGLVLSTLSFFFFLVRALFIITQRRSGFWADTGLFWKVIITLVLPLLGLVVNNGSLFGDGSPRQESGIFGNFTSPWFYALAVLNSILLCLTDSPRPGVRLLQLLGRSALFGYTFYFFLVFLPFLPLAIPAIILIGTGFLLLAPLMLFVVHVRQLHEDVAALQTVFARGTVRAALLGGLAVLPLVVTASFWHRRQVLHEALAYVYTPDFSQTEPVDPSALAATLTVVRQNKDRNMDFLFGSQQPYLSTYFNWLVLDNLMLSEEKLSELDRIFMGASSGYRWAPGWANDTPQPASSAPQLREATASSTYDARQQAWVSWVNLEIANPVSDIQNGEYSTAITLPTGCWVSDYYLTIGHRQERGILAEKRAATWVYAQILNENRSRDPGLLAYRRANEISLRVYPVSGSEVRRTRIQLLHKEPCTLTIDGRVLTLGDSTSAPPVAAPVALPGSGVAYVSALAKQRLPLVQRRPYYHFLLDASAGHSSVPAYEARVAGVLAQPLPNGVPARFSTVNAATTPVPAGADWAAQLSRTPLTGGFYLTGAIRRVLFEAQEHPAATYPVLVAVTDDLAQAVLAPDFEEFSSAFPESDVFYVLGADGQLVPHSLRHDARTPLATAPPAGAAVAVRAWPTAVRPRAYLPNTSTPSIVLSQRPAVPAPTAAPGNRWLMGLLLSGYHQWQTFHPEATEQERIPFIQASFRVGILTPFTSFLALENDAQKAALFRKQAETLAANASLDTVEKDAPPPAQTPVDGGAALLLAAGVLLGGWYLRRARPAVG
ncbi:MSEP-CTERM sorting domain-containing protein [Hymenobacter sp. 5317J-9]|uniref:MSEP-CTERM sorting domain-containing protein n=1 Tax=Hymenobacter sp. 5317J-9 TaxID=2932250 RepID=UPI001FD665F6|nr:MSEP-CTERM sorting domain-containing protein [Hymenobacter sp. 5317J-9]UOQ96586.1 MSEP-CTERM sorting domain-containing protein [Hymenobacter sp. 5317J-9]